MRASLALRSLAVAVAMLASAAAGSRADDPEPETPVVTPTTTVIAVSAGGHVVVAGTLETTPLGALRASGRALAGPFGAAPRIESVVETADGRGAYATFRGSYAGAPVVGLIAAVADGGGREGLVALADDPGRICTSLRPMLAAFAAAQARALGPADATPAPAEPLRSHAFSDGSGTVSLPANWTLRSAAKGRMQADGPHGEEALLGVTVNVADPRDAQAAKAFRVAGDFVLPYASDPRTVFVELQAELARRKKIPAGVWFAYAKPFEPRAGLRSAIVEATETERSGRETLAGVIAIGPRFYGAFPLFLDLVIAPTSDFERERSTLAAIFRSYRAYPRNPTEQSRRASEVDGILPSANERTVWDPSPPGARAAEDVIDGYGDYGVRASGAEVVDVLGAGGRCWDGPGFARTLTRRDARRFHAVAPADVRAGE